MTRAAVGFIGLGIMGKPMALNLVKGGHRLVVHSRSFAPVKELVGAGAVAADSPGAVAAQAGTVITMLPDTATVEEVVAELAPAMGAGGLIVDMGTSDPEAARRLAASLLARGIAFLDSPVSGGEAGAVAGSLSAMVGGDADAFARARPLLEAMCSRVTHLGGPGSGQVTKAVNQLVVIATIEVVAEALVLAAKAGVSPAKVREALLGGFAQSRILDAHGKRMLEHDFAPGGRLSLHVKDVHVIGGLAASLGVPLPAFAAAANQVASLMEHGGADLDHAALVTELERAAGIELTG